MRVQVVGSGIMGRLMARACVAAGWDVARTDDGSPAASVVAAGLLSPLSSNERPSDELVRRARASLDGWGRLLAGTNVAFARTGSLVLALDGVLLDDLQRMLATTEHRAIRVQTTTLEPELDRFAVALHLPDEGWLDAQAALAALDDGARAVDADVTIDCRGLGARDVLPLRGVRGELLVVHAPHVRITRPVRLLGRDAVYVVPRPDGRYIVGATRIESDSRAPITVDATLQLLVAACAIHPGFREAHVLEARVGVRPATPDHEPCVVRVGRTVRVNGLYRHGFVVGPALAEEAMAEVRRCASS